ncbi:hypothetical protein G7077_01370 [Sphingomonas piscis]|uniref:Uncharacterized protein n=1 Tax=Sphingomonas piscis TaxID=2714943 RepID=A0A6G7YLZ9_9SPHN|nr:hypothetical protein [Sphingomonas piscis]QIK77762.1 hypothetical protein G7077_01370 [Sphingomonas piscis]
MSSPLKEYRVYCFDARMKIVTSDFIKAASDEDAIAMAHARGFGTQCELWEQRRLVATLVQEEERRQA